MFGKTKEPTGTDDRPEADLTSDDFFGDEAAVAEAMRVDQLRQRVGQVEQQINSQFTSMAAYAQIAQEQIELVRSEAQHANERSEQRVVGLIERERADRLVSSGGSSIEAEVRLDALDTQVAEIRASLQQCLTNQKALADAIIDLFQPNGSQISSLGDTIFVEPNNEADVETDAVMPIPAGAPAPMPAPVPVDSEWAGLPRPPGFRS